jgi:hypothetical protein
MVLSATPSLLRRATAKLVAAALAALAATGTRDAVAENQDMGLPMFSACHPAAAPVLPSRWRAVGLMLPFLRRQLAAGEFVRDGSIPAMRATLYGLESGTVDLLITDKETYQLSGPPDAPTACMALGHKYDPPADSWLSGNSACDGEAPVGTKTAQWWKTAASDGRAIWQWYRTDTRLPWRIMLPERSGEPAVIGDYAVTYFTTFQKVPETNLGRLRDFCVAKAQKASPAAVAASTAPELMATGNDIGAAERAKRIQSLIPGLSRQACSSVSTPHWPNHFVMTGILTPIQFQFTPLPTMLYYDWEGAGTLVGMMNEPQTLPPALELEAILTKGVGYGIERLPNGAFACRAATPGAVRPDWMSVAGCACSGVIDHNAELGPNEVSVIRACPVKGEGDHVNWSWYTTEGRPILFTEPEAIGLGLNVADYDRWMPGAEMPQDAFALPEICTPEAAKLGLPPVGEGLPPELTVNCSDCHTTQK